MKPCSLDEIADRDKLAALAGEWFDLWRRCPAASPFQTPQWLLPWWDHFGGQGLHTLALRRDGRLTALAPLYYYTGKSSLRATISCGAGNLACSRPFRRPPRGCGDAALRGGQSCLQPAFGRPGASCRQAAPCQRGRLTLLGTGVSDYPDILVDPRESILPIVERLRQCDVDFSDLRPGSPLLALPLPAADAPQTERSSVSPVLTLPIAGRAGLRRQLARLSRQGQVRFETATPATFDEYLDALVKLHQARWTVRDQRGVFGSGPMTAFLRDAGRALLRTGLLRFHGLRLDGALIAALFSLLSRNTSYFYLSGFDPILSHFSPGALLIESAIRDAAARGAVEVDFLRGAEPYKYAWGARDRINLRMRWSFTEPRAA